MVSKTDRLLSEEEARALDVQDQVERAQSLPKSSETERKTPSVEFADVGTHSELPARGLHRYRRNTSSLSAIFSRSLRNIDLSPVREDFEESAQQIHTAFQDNVQTIKGEGFLDDVLTRSLSILPDDLEEFIDAVEDLNKGKGKGNNENENENKDEYEHSHEEQNRGSPLAQYIGLIGAVAAVSSNATALHLLDGVSAPLKFFWRMTASHLFLLFLAAPSLREHGFPKFTPTQWVTFFLAVVCYAVQGILFMLALESTTISNALMFANSKALLLIIGKGLMGEEVHMMEGGGVLVAFCGALLCCASESDDDDSGKFKEYDDLVDEDGNPVDPWDPVPSDDDQSDRVSSAFVGNALALCSAVAGIGYLTFAKAVRPHVNVSVFLWSVMLCGSGLMLIFLMIIDSNGQEALTWDMDQYTGIFGWLSPSGYRIAIVLYLAFVVTGLGTKGFVTAMAYFSTTMIAVATLLEPMLASLIATAAGVGHLPGMLGWVGNLLVAVGTLGVVLPSMKKPIQLKIASNGQTVEFSSGSEDDLDKSYVGNFKKTPKNAPEAVSTTAFVTKKIPSSCASKTREIV